MDEILTLLHWIIDPALSLGRGDHHHERNCQMDKILENRTWSEIKVGDKASVTKLCTVEELELFGTVSGDLNPSHFEGMDEKLKQRPVAHSMWVGSLISGVIGNELPGPGTAFVDQTLKFMSPVYVGETVRAEVVVESKTAPSEVVLACQVFNNETNKVVIKGRATVNAPLTKQKAIGHLLQEVTMRTRRHVFQRLVERASQGGNPISVAVAHPCDEMSLGGAIDAAQKGIIIPILVGPEARIRAVAEEFHYNLEGYRIVNSDHSHDSARLAVALCKSGEAQTLMKGSLHTDEIMHEVAARETGLRTSRRISHVFVFDVPTYPRTLLVTDAAINIYPTLEDKVDIVQNAIELAQVLGVEIPKVAILSAVETVNAKITSTLDAAALCKMADRGQIVGGILDGPLAFDNAISAEAAKIKHIDSPVAGQVDILLVPDLEAGNILAKQLSYLAEADAAGIVLGARVPIILTSRADSVESRLASCAVAALLARSKH
jgi:phosphate acetyltransferase